MKNSSPKDIKSYIASAPKESRVKLEEIKKIIKTLIPKAEENISYGMPAFKLNGKQVVGFAGYKKHIGFYPYSGSFLNTYKKELKNYITSKGAVQFPIEKPLPVTLIKKLVKGRLKEVRDIKDTKQKITKYNHHHKDGTIWAKGNMLGGKMHGYWEWFRKGGSKMRSGYFNNGKQTGEWVTYDKNGKVVKITMMK